MTETILTRESLNRALLARQMLLAREAVSPVTAIERLAGLQAQQARPPFVGLWSRIEQFERAQLRSLLESRDVVRATMMRCTLHLVSRADYLSFRPVLQPALTGAMQSILRERLGSFALEPVLAEARRHLAGRPRTFTELRNLLIERFPEADERAMGYAVRTQIPLIIATHDHDWGYRADPSFDLAEGWLGSPLPPSESPHALVLRYLAAFGPASAADLSAWSGLAGLTPVLRELQPQLRLFRDARKRELFDLPDAPRPPAETAAPVRFVADFDNLLLSHADRTRIIADAHRRAVITNNALVRPTFLLDGFVAGTWKVAKSRKTAQLTVTPFESLSAAAKSALEAEGEGLARFVEPDAERVEVRFDPA